MKYPKKDMTVKDTSPEDSIDNEVINIVSKSFEHHGTTLDENKV